MKDRSLSFIILNWNTPDLTLKCLKSIYKFVKLKNFQVIIVDNGSTDNSVSIFKKLNYKNLALVINKSNLGFSKGNNSAKKYFTTDYLVFLNSDIEFIDDSLIKAINYFNKHPNLGLIAPKLFLSDNSVQKSVFPPQNISNAIKEFWFGKNTFSPYYPLSKEASSVWAVAGAAILIKTDIFKKIGMWNELYFIYFEDLDLCRKIRQLNKKIIYFPKWQLIHHHGQSGKNLVTNQNQWKRLVPSSIKYHGTLKHYLLYLIIKLGAYGQDKK